MGARAGRGGSVSARSGRFGSRAIAGGAGTRATGGSVRTRPGTRRTGLGGTRVGRGYRVGGYGYGYGYGYGNGGFYWRWGGGWGWGWGGGGWGWGWGWGAPAYPLVFGYGVSYYPQTYATHFVDAVPYRGAVIVEEEIIVEDDVIEDGVIEDEIIEDEILEGDPPIVGKPTPQPVVDKPSDPGAPPPPKLHADFQPAIDAFLAGDYAGAKTRFESVTAAEPENGEAWLGQMHANFALGGYGEASRALSTAAALDAFPRGYRFDPRPLYAKGTQFEDVFAKLVQHTASNPDDADAQLLVAYFQVALGERAQATSAIHRVLELRPEDPTAPALAMALLPPPPPPSQPKSDAK